MLCTCQWRWSESSRARSVFRPVVVGGGSPQVLAGWRVTGPVSAEPRPPRPLFLGPRRSDPHRGPRRWWLVYRWLEATRRAAPEAALTTDQCCWPYKWSQVLTLFIHKILNISPTLSYRNTVIWRILFEPSVQYIYRVIQKERHFLINIIKWVQLTKQNLVTLQRSSFKVF